MNITKGDIYRNLHSDDIIIILCVNREAVLLQVQYYNITKEYSYKRSIHSFTDFHELISKRP